MYWKVSFKTCNEEKKSFYVVSIAEQAGFNLTLSDTPKSEFSRHDPYDAGHFLTCATSFNVSNI